LFYSELFDSRQGGGYADFVEFDAQIMLPLLEKAEDFIATLKNFIEH